MAVHPFYTRKATISTHRVLITRVELVTCTRRDNNYSDMTDRYLLFRYYCSAVEIAQLVERWIHTR